MPWSVALKSTMAPGLSPNRRRSFAGMTTHPLAETLACLAGRDSMKTLPEKRYTFAAAEYYNFSKTSQTSFSPIPRVPCSACCPLSSAPC